MARASGDEVLWRGGHPQRRSTGPSGDALHLNVGRPAQVAVEIDASATQELGLGGGCFAFLQGELLGAIFEVFAPTGRGAFEATVGNLVAGG